MWGKELIQKEAVKGSSDQKSPNNPLWSGMKAVSNVTETENFAKTFKSTNSAVLDLFSMGGALRNRSQEDVEKLVSKALSEDLVLAMKCIFYLRDIRGGQGERETFRKALKVISKYNAEETKRLVGLIPEYGRFDDILSLENIDIQDFVLGELEKDDSLIAKWLPSENAGKKSARVAKALRKYLGLNSKNYRMLLREKRQAINIVETKVTEGRFKDIDYSKIPSGAGLKYAEVFKKKDEVRYADYLKSVEKGEKKINVKDLFPYEIVRKARESNDKSYDVMWKKLPNYVKEGDNSIVVADVSGSMEGLPMCISVSLAMYFAERSKGVFNNKFITFSERPELQEVKGNSLNQKIVNLENAHWNMNTNLQKVFDLILKTAVSNKVKEEDMIKTLYIISDMEFDRAVNDYGQSVTNFELAKERYRKAGYEIPQVVFWNVDSRQNNVPVTENEDGVILVSGASPSIFKMVMQKTTPLEFMNKVLNSERYKPIEEALKE